MPVVYRFNGLFEANRDDQTDHDGCDVNEKVFPGMHGLVGRMDFEHWRAILFDALRSVGAGLLPWRQSFRTDGELLLAGRSQMRLSLLDASKSGTWHYDGSVRAAVAIVRETYSGSFIRRKSAA